VPERILMFGTGAFLRGFVGEIIDEAIRDGRYEGRIVMVQSTGRRRADLLNGQGGLFTLRLEGLQAGETLREFRVCGAVSRALSAAGNWPALLELAREPAMDTVISNTTEVGITFQEESSLTGDTAPASFPGKLVAWLYARWQHFDGAAERGVTVLPCELIPDNGQALLALLLRQAQGHELPAAFQSWLKEDCRFVDTLVDRIVSGSPSAEKQAAFEAELGYEDAMLTVCEPFRFWALAGEANLGDHLPWALDRPGIVMQTDIAPFRERKVRILNGAHTLLVALAYLHGCDTVAEAMEHAEIGPFLEAAIREEIIPALDLPADLTGPFAAEVLDRFRNPFLGHQLLDISLQYTSKIKARNVPAIVAFVRKTGKAPARAARSFAAFLHFVRPVKQDAEGNWYGRRGDTRYRLRDEQTPFWAELYAKHEGDAAALVQVACAAKEIWGEDLSTLPGWVPAVQAAHEGLGGLK